jgi:hypothetical protein
LATKIAPARAPTPIGVIEARRTPDLRKGRLQSGKVGSQVATTWVPASRPS